MFSPEWSSVDRVASCLVLPLGIWILLSGIDDLIVDVSGFMAGVRNRFRKAPTRRELFQRPQQRIAIFIPCWHESGVIADMIAGNRDRVSYGPFDFFIGVYPNDLPTCDVVQALENRFDNVHLAMCPHHGPTSKADCLNWIYQRMLLFEAATGARFGIIVTHDAEDVIHPDGLLWINWYSPDYEMVQVPVLPLPTRLTMWTHGVYCDEFAEYQYRDMPARQFMGAFVPSNGVGTGFRRQALDGLAAVEGNRIFEPVCLTEDYENGLRLKLRGARQIFVSVHGREVATREYFPLTFRTAVRQRTRWVTGIALQTWERHGWRGSAADKYWLWRDRKGLIGNPASLLTNVLLAYGAVCGALDAFAGYRSAFSDRVTELSGFLALTSAMGVYRILFRAWCVSGSFGWRFAAGVPVRMVAGNCINSLATLRALSRYFSARVHGEPLVWVKTEHQFPTASTLQSDRRPLGEVLVMSGFIGEAQLQQGLATCPQNRRLGEHLVALGYLTEDELCEALSLQTQLPLSRVEPEEVPRFVARAIPAYMTRDRQVVPFRVEDGKLLLATSEEPEDNLRRDLQRFTNLEIRFHLVTLRRLESLIQSLL